MEANTTVQIRRFVTGDEETYARIYNEGYSTEEWWLTREKPITLRDASSRDYDVTFFAEIDEQAIGLIDIKIHGDIAHIENLVVLPKHRRKGVGTALLDKATKFSKIKLARRMRAETPVQNSSEFYERNGFELARHAFLIRVKSKLTIDPSMRLSFEGDDKYWVDNDQRMESIRERRLDFGTIAKFKVMVKMLRSEE
ncbi:MAG: GNAT family N-acetyltransferase [Candidatus Bathyarchaeota archaeon]